MNFFTWMGEGLVVYPIKNPYITLKVFHSWSKFTWLNYETFNKLM